MSFRQNSLHHSFTAASHPGFTRSIDPRAARRQLHVSLAVVVVLALAIAGSVVAIRPVDGFDLRTQHARLPAPAAVNDHDVDTALGASSVDRT